MTDVPILRPLEHRRNWRGMGEIFHWNPKVLHPGLRGVARGPLRRPLTRLLGRRPNNFGDLIGPLIVEWMLKRRGVAADIPGAVRLMSVGSIMHFAVNGDVIWGSGVNGKVRPEWHRFNEL